MKKIIIVVAALALLSTMAFAGDNQSAKYIRMLSREAATDGMDIAYFNPAGTAFMTPGFHVEFDAQTVYLNYSHTSPDVSLMGGPGATDMEMKNWVPFVPALYLGYVGSSWSVFASYNIPEGGGSLNYDDIVVAIPAPGYLRGSLEASSSTHAFSLGGAYAIGDYLSVGAKGEMSFATMSADAVITDSYYTIAGALNGTAEMKASGIGWGGAFGIHARPFDGFNVSIATEMGQNIDMDIKESSSTNPNLLGVVEAMASDADRPWKIRAGASYSFPFGLEIPVSFKYSFWKAVDKDVYKDTWDAKMAFRYWLMDTLELSFGGSYSTGNSQDDDLDSTFMNPELDSLTFAAGFGWEVIENLDIDFGMLYPIYFGEDGTAYTNMKKQVIDVGLGVSYSF